MKARRTYTKVRRAEAEGETRDRIVAALLALHEEVGPARTTISAVADRAGVERLTVYRHFPDERSMFQACSSRWIELNPPPPLPEAREGEPLAVCRKTLLALYGWFRRNARLLAHIHVDVERLPAMREEVARTQGYLDAVASALDGQWPARNAQRRLTLRHAVTFSTWRSLDSATGNDRQSVALVLAWLSATARSARRRPS